MPSNEGHGTARKAWDSYVAWTQRNVAPITDPVIGPLARRYAANKVSELVGFWVLWHAYGGYQGLVETLGMAPTTVYRKVKWFRIVFGEHPDGFEFPGLAVDLKKWHSSPVAE
ncbi:MAG: hypothetical protein JWR83_3089 [Aeromicrobium sp.]|nr:hypothetical protein [Aeromicrobium sp.]